MSNIWGKPEWGCSHSKHMTYTILKLSDIWTSGYSQAEVIQHTDGCICWQLKALQCLIMAVCAGKCLRVEGRPGVAVTCCSGKDSPKPLDLIIFVLVATDEWANESTLACCRCCHAVAPIAIAIEEVGSWVGLCPCCSHQRNRIFTWCLPLATCEWLRQSVFTHDLYVYRREHLW